jgi:hypothetical protein
MTEFEEGAIEITIIIVGGESDETTRNITINANQEKEESENTSTGTGSGRKELRHIQKQKHKC